MLDSKVWTVERPNVWAFYVFKPLKAHTYELNISLIKLILIMQNPEQQHILPTVTMAVGSEFE